jgi:hypothetical protein
VGVGVGEGEGGRGVGRVRLGYELFDFVFPGGIVSKIAKINRFVYCQDEEVIAI